MHWLRSVGGRCSTGIQADHEIGMVPAVRLTSANGKSVVYIGNQNEALTLSMIAYFDRRLGVMSPFVAGRPS